MSGRVFGASLKPAWANEKIERFLQATAGDIIVYLINHDKDSDENGEIIEEHTHVYLEYASPRKTSTVANLLGVESNFIEVIRNKKGYLRYLTHMDDKAKYQYDSDEVATNNSVEYASLVMGNSMTDKEIAEYISQGRGMELLGIVSASKLRTIQGFMHFDQSNLVLQEIRGLNDKITYIVGAIENVESFAKQFSNGLTYTADELSKGMLAIASELGATRKVAAMAIKKRL